MTPARPKRPIVAVVGATGTGKSQLAVELAKKFNGEVINGDAMQLYHGLPIITNKVTEEEMSGVPHHLLSRIGLCEPTWTVSNFVKEASKLIEDIHARGRLPVLVGGTHYYTQSLLLSTALTQKDEQDEAFHARDEDRSSQFPILNEETDVIMEELRKVDPIMADRWHPNDRRKIRRSLEIYLTTGKTASQTYEEQKMDKTSAEDGQDLTQRMRYNTLLFWLHARHDVLTDRLNARVDRMVDAGLMNEVDQLSDFLRTEKQGGRTVDRSKGIWVSIGYKEFEAYQAGKVANVTEKELARLKVEGIERTQAATRQYAKRQVRWIRIKLMHALAAAEASRNLFLLDGTDLGEWETTVRQPAIDITQSFLDGAKLPDPVQFSSAAVELLTPKQEYDISQRPDLWQRRTCDICGVTAVTDVSWIQHLKSKGHKHAVLQRAQRQGTTPSLEKYAG